jgi:hypothetical protein
MKMKTIIALAACTALSAATLGTLAHSEAASAKGLCEEMKDKQALKNLKPDQKVEFDLVKQGPDYVIPSIK